MSLEQTADNSLKKDQNAAVSRREFLKLASASGLASATSGFAFASSAAASNDGTPEQIHITWGKDPTSEVTISWSSPGRSVHPRVKIKGAGEETRTEHADQRIYTDGLNDEIVYSYHARVHGLNPGRAYTYEVTADNDRNLSRPFSSSFQTAPRDLQPFRWTSFGDLATPNPVWTLSYPQARFAVMAVERFQPLFHLLNGDLSYANLSSLSQPEVWRDFANNVQISAANRPWMPCPANHEIEFYNGPQGIDSYLSRYSLPDNGTSFPGHWYSFRVGSVFFISLDGSDVAYQDSGPAVGGPNSLSPAPATGNAPIPPGTSFYVRGYSKGEQTRWLERTLRKASEEEGVDWIVVQTHYGALSSTKTGNGSDKGAREEWLPLFDKYGVDLVLCGHDHDYERSYPVRGANHDAGTDAATGAVVDTLQPRPIIPADPAATRFDTRQGTVHLILGGGGTSAPLDVYGEDSANGKVQAKVFTKRNEWVAGTTPGTFARKPSDALEDAIWSAQRDTSTGYGIGVFDYEPCRADGKTTITFRYYHAVGADKTPTGDYELFETIVFEKEKKERGT